MKNDNIEQIQLLMMSNEIVYRCTYVTDLDLDSRPPLRLNNTPQPSCRRGRYMRMYF